MCQQNDGQTIPAATEGNEPRAADFPWHIGVADAHCHPTDTMSSVKSISSMQARVLTVMSTRSQDQDLVASVAAEHAIRDRAAIATPATQHTTDRVVPAFGWHPWFSYQLYDDTDGAEGGSSSSSTYNPSAPRDERKTKHYSAVLTPAPDAKFIAGLPDPTSLRSFLDDTRRRVLDAGPAALIGEIGLDKAFRLPWPWNAAEHSSGRCPDGDEAPTPGGREGRRLSPHHVKMAHQVQVLKAQLRLAGELGVAVSVHGVQAHGVLLEALESLWKGHYKEVVSRRKQRMVAQGAEDFSSSEEEEEEDEWEEPGDEGPSEAPRIAGKAYKPKPFPPRVCLHSYSGSAQTVQQYLNPAIPSRIYFSFSTVINLSTTGVGSRFHEIVRACADDRLLVESDLHCAGEEMDRMLEDISRRVCEIKGWSLEEGLTRIRRNYEDFIFG